MKSVPVDFDSNDHPNHQLNQQESTIFNLLNNKKKYREMVPRRGLEPPLGYPNMHLKHARLPIPPPRHEVRALIYLAREKGGRTLLI